MNAEASTSLDHPNVTVGIYVNRINSISYKNGTFAADITLWFRWTNNKIHPNKTFKIKDAKIDFRREIFDGYIEGTKTRWAAVDIQTNISNKWDISKYPFDTQSLKVQIEENEDDTSVVLYSADTDNIKLGKYFDIQGWRVDGAQSYISSNTYETNFGYLDKQDSGPYVSTQFNYKIDIERTSSLNGLKLLFAPILAIAMLLISSLLPTTASARFGVVTSCIFALVSSHYLIQGQLPESDRITIAEMIVIFGLAEALYYFLITVISFNANEQENIDFHKKLDRLLPLSLIIFNLFFISYIVILIR
jgi:hypothetical protein